jgi:hypothetical protein
MIITAGGDRIIVRSTGLWILRGRRFTRGFRVLGGDVTLLCVFG